jgi:hypothetical protein
MFYLDVAYISRICCKYFIWMLHMFAMGFKYFSGIFASASNTCSSVSLVFFMLQVLHLNISKVDRCVAYRMLWEAGGGASGHHTWYGGVGDIRPRATSGGDVGSPLERSLTSSTLLGRSLREHCPMLKPRIERCWASKYSILILKILRRRG